MKSFNQFLAEKDSTKEEVKDYLKKHRVASKDPEHHQALAAKYAPYAKANSKDEEGLKNTALYHYHMARSHFMGAGDAKTDKAFAKHASEYSAAKSGYNKLVFKRLKKDMK